MRLLGFVSRASLIVAAITLPVAASGQTAAQVRVTRATVVMEGPRGDSVVLEAVPAGTVLELLAERGRWVQVSAPTDSPNRKWQRGWIHASYVEFVGARPVARSAKRRDWMVRGFGQFGGTFFAARDSFEAILDSAFGSMYGGGGQVVSPNGSFLQVGVDRFRKTGARVVVSGEQVFRVAIPNTVTVTPVSVTLGYRDERSGRVVGYAGAGAGRYVLEEMAPSVLDGHVRKGHLGFHLTGGVEYRIAPFIWLAGEARWATVPDGLGTTGVGPVFKDTDLGGTTVRFKLLVGH